MPFKITEQHHRMDYGCDPWLVSGTTDLETPHVDIVPLLNQINEERVLRQESWEKVKKKADEVIRQSKISRLREAELTKQKKIRLSVDRIHENIEKNAKQKINVLVAKVFFDLLSWFIALKNSMLSTHFFHQVRHEKDEMNTVHDNHIKVL